MQREPTFSKRRADLLLERVKAAGRQLCRRRARRGPLSSVGLLAVVTVGVGFGLSACSPRALVGPAATTTSSRPSTVSTSTTTTAPPAAGVSEVTCGSGFFAGSDLTYLKKSFGDELACSRAGNSDTWLAIFSPEVNNPVPGPHVVLVETCSRSDSDCLAPDALHPLSGFTGYPAPDPTTQLVFTGYVRESGKACPSGCVAARSGALAIIGDGLCNLDIFDLANDHWYFGDTATAAKLAAGDDPTVEQIPSAPGFFPSQASPIPRPASVPAVCGNEPQ